eukprot:3189856-Prymnesium_polylepis.1
MQWRGLSCPIPRFEGKAKRRAPSHQPCQYGIHASLRSRSRQVAITLECARCRTIMQRLRRT